MTSKTHRNDQNMSHAHDLEPKAAPDVRDLPHPLTFYMTGRERLQILRALRRLDGNRLCALKRALNLI
jgi:hypothetical protein